MLQNLDISESVATLCDYFAKNEHINSFCKAHFDKEITVFGGDFLRRDLPSKAECPYIILTDFKKHEGLNTDFCNYSFTLFVGVSTKKLEEFTTESGTVIPDVYDVCAKLMTLIQHELNERNDKNRPPSMVDTRGPFPVMGAHWAGRLDVQMRIYQVLGSVVEETI